MTTTDDPNANEQADRSYEKRRKHSRFRTFTDYKPLEPLKYEDFKINMDRPAKKRRSRLWRMNRRTWTVPTPEKYGFTVEQLKRWHRLHELGWTMNRILLRARAVGRFPKIQGTEIKYLWDQLGLDWRDTESMDVVKKELAAYRQAMFGKFEIKELVLYWAALKYCHDNDIDLRAIALETWDARGVQTQHNEYKWTTMGSAQEKKPRLPQWGDCAYCLKPTTTKCCSKGCAQIIEHKRRKTELARQIKAREKRWHETRTKGPRWRGQRESRNPRPPSDDHNDGE